VPAARSSRSHPQRQRFGVHRRSGAGLGQGYGLQIGSWNEQLDNSDEVAVSTVELLKASDGNEEWFYNLDAVYLTPSTTVHFGLHDSTALFWAAPAPIALQIVADFSNVQAVDPA